jgi:hypothetical protein
MRLSEANVIQLDLAVSGVRTRFSAWPFLYTVEPDLGLVVNVEPEASGQVSAARIKQAARAKPAAKKSK